MAAAWLANGGKLLNIKPKPLVPAIDWSSPLTRGLVFDANYLALGDQGNIERVGGVRSTYTATTPSVSPFGAVRTFPGGAATDRDTYVTRPAVNGLTNNTIEILFKSNGAGGDGSFLVWKGGTGTGYRFNLWHYNVDGLIYFSSGFATTNGFWFTDNDVMPDGVWNHFVVTYSFSATSNDPIFYLNGKLITVNQDGANPSGAATSDTTSLLIGNDPTAFAVCANADISHTRFWNRILTGREVLQLYKDPFQIYKRPRKPVVYAPPGGGPVDGAGSIALDIAVAGVGRALKDSVGSVGLDLAVAGVGRSAVSSVGSIGLDIAVAGTGVTAVRSEGSIALNLAVAGVGKSLADSVGSIALDIAVAGVATNSNTGAGSVTLDIAVAGVGRTARQSVGTVSLDLAVAGVGKSFNNSVGAVALNIAVAGVGVTSRMGVGSISLDLAVTGVGRSTNPSVGAIALNVAVAGVGAAGQSTGTIGLNIDVAGVTNANFPGNAYVTGQVINCYLSNVLVWNPVGPGGGSWTPVVDPGGSWTPVDDSEDDTWTEVPYGPYQN